MIRGMESSETWAVVPVKALDEVKQRLAPALPPDVRARLVLTMLEDVLRVTVSADGIARAIVVTSDARVREIAHACGAGIAAERGARGLNAAVRTGVAHARAHGARRVLVLPGDVPLTRASEVAAVLATAHAGGNAVQGRAHAATRARITLVPSADGEGTNALLLAPPDALEPAFGPGSFVRHLARAVARKLDTQVLQLPGIGADIDEPRDLLRLAGNERYAFLRPYAPGPGAALAGDGAGALQDNKP